MKYNYLYGLMICVAGFAACSDDDEKTDDPTLPEEPEVPVEVPLSVELEATYETPMGQVLQIAPKVTGSGEYTYEWKEGETVISTRDTLEYVRPEAKTYHLTLTVKSETEADTVECDVAVSAAEVKTSGLLFEYKPTMVTMDESDGKKDNAGLRVPYDQIKGFTSSRYYYYLGSTGGYCVFKFDHTVANLPDSLDFEASMYNRNSNGYGDALYIVYVAYDRNKNGEPDENEWYEIKGSQYGTDNEIADYEITYDGFPSADALFFNEDEGEYMFEITWKDNQGNSNTDYIWSMEPDYEEYTCPLPGTYLDGSGFYEGWEPLPWVRKGKVLKSFPEDKTGYIFVAEKAKGVITLMDIDWAVDKDGNPAMLPGIDFVKIQNASPKIEEKQPYGNNRYLTGSRLLPRANDNTIQ